MLTLEYDMTRLFTGKLQDEQTLTKIPWIPLTGVGRPITRNFNKSTHYPIKQSILFNKSTDIFAFFTDGAFSGLRINLSDNGNTNDYNYDQKFYCFNFFFTLVYK